MRPPIVGGEQWLKCMQAADYRCECTIYCGRKHEGRCGVGPTNKKPLAVVSLVEGFVNQVRDGHPVVLCSDCTAGVYRERRRKNSQQPDQEGLF